MIDFMMMQSVRDPGLVIEGVGGGEIFEILNSV